MLAVKQNFCLILFGPEKGMLLAHDENPEGNFLTGTMNTEQHLVTCGTDNRHLNTLRILVSRRLINLNSLNMGDIAVERS